MRWGSPEILPWLLLALPAAWLVFFLMRRRERRLGRMVDPAVVPLLAPRRDRARARRRAMLWLAALATLGAALARPQWGFHWEEVKRRGLDIMVVLDTSRSMLAEDIKPNRLQQAQWGIQDLVKKLRGDRVGLVSFAGSSFLQCPLTMDYAAFLMTLEDVYVGIIPKGGTAIAQALRTAIDSFEESGEADRAIVLVTDGEDHEGEPLRLVDELKKKNIRVYAVGVGTLDGELIPTQDAEGHVGFFKNREGEVVKTRMQENVLQELAVGTGGVYVRSAPGDFGLDRIFDQGIAELKRDEQEARMIKAYEDRFMWYVGAALLLLALEAVLTDRARRATEGAA